MCYSRHIGAERAAAEAAEALIAGSRPPTADEARGAAVAEGLELVPSSCNETGFKGVTKFYYKGVIKYQAQIWDTERGSTRFLGSFARAEDAAMCAADALSRRVVGYGYGKRLLQEYKLTAMQPPKPRVARLAGSSSLRAMLGVEAEAGHEFPVGSWLEVRSRAHGNRHPQFERVRVYESDDSKTLRIEMAGELLFIVREEWEVWRAPALPPAPLAFGAAYTGQVPDAAALATSSASSAARCPRFARGT